MRILGELLSLLLLVAVPGCALFTADSLVPSDPVRKADRPESGIRQSDVPTPPVKRIARLKATHIIRPARDERIRRHVWSDLCEIVFREPQERQRLNENGFRVGVTGSPFPWALSSLLTAAGDRSRSASSAPRDGRLYFSASGEAGSTVVIPEGGESIIEVRTGTVAEIPQSQTLPGLQNAAPSDQVRCLFRIRTVDSGSGWVRFQFLPELHFGRPAMRLTVREGRQELPVRQKIVPLFDQQFEVKLHTKDAVILGYHPGSDWTWGQFFFRTSRLTSADEVLLVLQLNELELVEGRPSVQVRYSRY